jgi:hypothetical protein
VVNGPAIGIGTGLVEKTLEDLCPRFQWNDNRGFGGQADDRRLMTTYLVLTSRIILS